MANKTTFQKPVWVVLSIVRMASFIVELSVTHLVIGLWKGLMEINTQHSFCGVLSQYWLHNFLTITVNRAKG